MSVQQQRGTSLLGNLAQHQAPGGAAMAVDAGDEGMSRYGIIPRKFPINGTGGDQQSGAQFLCSMLGQQPPTQLFRSRLSSIHDWHLAPGSVFQLPPGLDEQVGHQLPPSHGSDPDNGGSEQQEDTGFPGILQLQALEAELPSPPWQANGQQREAGLCTGQHGSGGAAGIPMTQGLPEEHAAMDGFELAMAAAAVSGRAPLGQGQRMPPAAHQSSAAAAVAAGGLLAGAPNEQQQPAGHLMQPCSQVQPLYRLAAAQAQQQRARASGSEESPGGSRLPSSEPGEQLREMNAADLLSKEDGGTAHQLAGSGSCSGEMAEYRRLLTAQKQLAAQGQRQLEAEMTRHAIWQARWGHGVLQLGTDGDEEDVRASAGHLHAMLQQLYSESMDFMMARCDVSEELNCVAVWAAAAFQQRQDALDSQAQQEGALALQRQQVAQLNCRLAAEQANNHRLAAQAADTEKVCAELQRQLEEAAAAAQQASEQARTGLQLQTAEQHSKHARADLQQQLQAELAARQASEQERTGLQRQLEAELAARQASEQERTGLQQQLQAELAARQASEQACTGLQRQLEAARTAAQVREQAAESSERALADQQRQLSVCQQLLIAEQQECELLRGQAAAFHEDQQQWGACLHEHAAAVQELKDSAGQQLTEALTKLGNAHRERVELAAQIAQLEAQAAASREDAQDVFGVMFKLQEVEGELAEVKEELETAQSESTAHRLLLEEARRCAQTQEKERELARLRQELEVVESDSAVRLAQLIMARQEAEQAAAKRADRLFNRAQMQLQRAEAAEEQERACSAQLEAAQQQFAAEQQRAAEQLLAAQQQLAAEQQRAAEQLLAAQQQLATEQQRAAEQLLAAQQQLAAEQQRAAEQLLAAQQQPAAEQQAVPDASVCVDGPLPAQARLVTPVAGCRSTAAEPIGSGGRFVRWEAHEVLMMRVEALTQQLAVAQAEWEEMAEQVDGLGDDLDEAVEERDEARDEQDQALGIIEDQLEQLADLAAQLAATQRQLAELKAHPVPGRPHPAAPVAKQKGQGGRQGGKKRKEAPQAK